MEDTKKLLLRQRRTRAHARTRTRRLSVSPWKDGGGSRRQRAAERGDGRQKRGKPYPPSGVTDARCRSGRKEKPGPPRTRPFSRLYHVTPPPQRRAAWPQKPPQNHPQRGNLLILGLSCGLNKNIFDFTLLTKLLFSIIIITFLWFLNIVVFELAGVE